MNVTTPSFEWKWNINTVAVLVGFSAGFIAWGYTLAELETGRTTNAANIESLTRRISIVENESRMLANHELRITNVERQAVDAASAMRAVEASLNSLAADMKVTREILQRLEAAQSRGRP
ncbi:hypothetical protein [Mesorhizobium sp. CAU 1741]|uniref:hypothetical protein n=1 Tax=Mesorhizobium sp. CAU 1741 TaxID=3140366 RepID=UPI00325BCDF1